MPSLHEAVGMCSITAAVRMRNCEAYIYLV